MRDVSEAVWGRTFFGTTIGAGPIDGRLRSDNNRKKDVMLDIKKQMINLNVSDTATINNLFTLEGNFHNDTSIDYEWFPNGLSNGFNSNSFTRGLLNAAGITIPSNPSKSVPGWGKPLSGSYFGQ